MILDRYLPKNKWIRAVLFLLFDICMTGVCAFFSLWVRFDMSVASVPKQYAEAARLFLPYISVSSSSVGYISIAKCSAST